MLLSDYANFGNKNSKFLKKKGANKLLSSLRIETPLNKIPLLGDILF